MTTGFYDAETGHYKIDYSGTSPKMEPVDLIPRDEEILAARRAALDEVTGPRIGDYVVFTDGVTRRFAHDWGTDNGIQTCDGGSFYLGDGYVSMSGSLYGKIPHSSLTLTEQVHDGSVWFFHEDWAKAHNAVHVKIPFRIYTTTLTSKENT